MDSVLFMEYFWAIAIITSPLVKGDDYSYQMIKKTYSSRLSCEIKLQEFITYNKPFAENQTVRCEKVDEIIGVLVE